MCAPDVPDPPVVPERQSPKSPKGSVRDQLADKDRRRRGFAAAMFSGANGAPTVSNITGV